MSKRIFDFLLSLIGLILLSPIFIIIAFWIMADSSGGIFYRQERIGKNGKPFRIHKFRTMVVNADKSGGLTVGKDNRITNSGQVLRRYKLDELPQLIDVLFGKMSLVGPRPEIAEFMNLYPDDMRQKILSVRPGITDWASIHMVDENDLLAKYDNPRQAYIDEIMPQKAQFYVQYVENQSLWEDIKIILATIKKIFIR
ncbi:MAG: sugar transferase [Neisseriaceae bacterium]|nr:sugar transferase [Neisseriaceae bacterium]MBR3424453.1 sugar transferase [Neisseriaceae bacterium]